MRVAMRVVNAPRQNVHSELVSEQLGCCAQQDSSPKKMLIIYLRFIYSSWICVKNCTLLLYAYDTHLWPLKLFAYHSQFSKGLIVNIAWENFVLFQKICETTTKRDVQKSVLVFYGIFFAICATQFCKRNEYYSDSSRINYNYHPCVLNGHRILTANSKSVGYDRLLDRIVFSIYNKHIHDN